MGPRILGPVVPVAGISVKNTMPLGLLISECTSEYLSYVRPHTERSVSRYETALAVLIAVLPHGKINTTAASLGPDIPVWKPPITAVGLDPTKASPPVPGGMPGYFGG